MYAGLRPGPVTGLQVTTRTDTTLHITWTVSADIHIDRFEVTYSYTVNRCSAQPGPQRTDTITAGSTRSHTLTGLNEDSRYSITVRAINNEGSTNATVSADTMTSGKCSYVRVLSYSSACVNCLLPATLTCTVLNLPIKHTCSSKWFS